MLDDILARKRREIELLPMLADVALAPSLRSFRDALRGDGLAIIAEVKRRSPSAGAIDESVQPARQARRYVEGGAAAISVLTDGGSFGGSYDDLREVAAAVQVPVLCKDFILDERQVRHARRAGADACLLVVAALQEPELRRLMAAVRRLNMCPLVEAHNERELQCAAHCGAEIIGVNNRDLATMRVNMDTIARLAPLAPPGCTLVAESGYASSNDLLNLPSRVSAVLVGTALMRSADPAATLTGWRRALAESTHEAKETRA